MICSNEEIAEAVEIAKQAVTMRIKETRYIKMGPWFMAHSDPVRLFRGCTWYHQLAFYDVLDFVVSMPGRVSDQDHLKFHRKKNNGLITTVSEPNLTEEEWLARHKRT